MLEYLNKYHNQIIQYFLQHLVLMGISLGIALLIALPVGFFLAKFKKIAVPVLAILSIIYAIPSLALFVLLIPVVGLGMKPAIIALVCYSQLILVRNVVAGFQAIDSSIIEAGKGMGLNSLQLFWKIELPLALPVVLGGIRIASVSVISIGTIAAWINAGGLGVLLFQGLYQNSTPKIVCGTALVSLLAVVTNQVFINFERYATLKARGEI